jgi:hypothetical protein
MKNECQEEDILHLRIRRRNGRVHLIKLKRVLPREALYMGIKGTLQRTRHSGPVSGEKGSQDNIGRRELELDRCGKNSVEFQVKECKALCVVR